MDVSGDANATNYKFLGIVLGADNNIMGLSNDIGSYPEHMSRIKNRDKPKIIQKLEFDNENRIAFCVKLDRKKIVDKIIKSRRARSTGKGKIFRTYNYVLIQEIKKIIEKFLVGQGKSVTEIIFQCDKDSDPFIKAGGLKLQRKGAAYRISDYIAWCNNKNKRPKSVIEINFTKEIPKRMKKILELK